MRKKLQAAALLLALACLLAGCLGSPAEIVVLPGEAGVEDGAANQAVWEGVRVYAGVHNRQVNYRQPANNGALAATLADAMADAPEAVVLCGEPWAPLLAEAAAWPESDFILVDAAPEGEIPQNAAALHFAVEEAGYLAGWAVVQAGYTKLGYLSADGSEAARAYGLGFAAGAADAAGRDAQALELRWSLAAGPGTAAAWYAAGTEVIFAPGEAEADAIAAANEADEAWVVAADRDAGSLSPRVLLSTWKDYGAAVGRALEAHDSGEFAGGEVSRLGADGGYLGLLLESSRLEGVSAEAYEAQAALLAEGEAGPALPKDEPLPDAPEGIPVLVEE